MSTAKEWKEKGNALVKEKKYQEALDCYTKSIELDPSDPILYSNRSAMYTNLGKYDEAIKDADKAIELNPAYGKAYIRKGSALYSQNKIDEALQVYKLGLEKDPNNEQIKNAINEIEINNNPFMKNYHKLFTDPRTANLMKDPQFKNLLDYGMKDQKFLLDIMQKDPRFMDVFSVLTGLDLTKMNEEVREAEQKKKEEEEKKKKEDEEKKKKEEEERKKKEEEDKYNAMTPEEKKEIDEHKKADEIKLKGNEEYKKKNFDEAIKYYNEAKEIYPKEMNYYLNLSRCYMEKKDYDKAIELCKYVCENTSDFQKKSTAYGIIGYAYQSQNKINEAIDAFESSLLEKKDNRIKDALKQAEKIKKKLEEEAYIDPVKAEEENEKANQLFKAGKYPDALKIYNEAIRRNPKLPKYYTNRATCFIKLMEFASAIKDCDKAIEIEPNTIKAYQKKATCHLMMKEYHRSLECLEFAMKKFPDDMELKNIYSKTMQAIQSSSGKDNEERVKHAYADPEIQALIKDPRIQQLFKDLQENPQSAQQAIMKDPFIADAFKKLVAAGIINTK